MTLRDLPSALGDYLGKAKDDNDLHLRKGFIAGLLCGLSKTNLTKKYCAKKLRILETEYFSSGFDSGYYMANNYKTVKHTLRT